MSFSGKSLGQQVAGPLARIWAGGAGPSHSGIDSALSTAGVDPSDYSGNKEAKVRAAVASADDATARRLIEELVDLLEVENYFESETDVWASRLSKLQMAIEPHGSLSDFGRLAWNDNESEVELVGPRPPAPTATSSAIKNPSLVNSPAQSTQTAPSHGESDGGADPNQILSRHRVDVPGPSIAFLVQMLRNIPHAARPLVGPRRKNQHSVRVVDEYDAQDFVHQTLRLLYADTRPEEVVPSYAGRSARTDFLIRDESTVIEVKVTREGRGQGPIRDEIIVDQRTYAEHPHAKRLIAVVYDLVGNFTNPAGFEADLSKPSAGGMENLVIVARWPEAT